MDEVEALKVLHRLVSASLRLIFPLKQTLKGWCQLGADRYCSMLATIVK
jgi:hypothetical protein